MTTHQQDTSAEAGPASIPRTSDVPFFSSLHGRERRALRGIDRRDLQAAVKHGKKSRGWPHPITGEPRWKYTYADVVYITDESSTREITSYTEPIAVPRAGLTLGHIRDYETAKERLTNDPSSCTSHTVIVVDQSASMNTSDIFDFRNRSQAVFGMLALDFVGGQRLMGVATETDVVSLVVMKDSAHVIFRREPMGLVLYNKFVGLHDDDCAGSYLPALAQADELLQDQAHGGCALSLLFLSDGKPSDYCTLPWYLRSSHENTLNKIIERVSTIAAIFGQQLSVSTLGFASGSADFSVLEAMAKAARDAGAQGNFYRPELSSEGLGTAIADSVSSLTATRARLTTLAIGEVRQPRQLRQVEREAAGTKWGHAPTAMKTGNGWIVYITGVERMEFRSSSRIYNGGCFPWRPADFFSQEASGIAIREKAMGEGAERLVFGLREFDVANGKLVGPKLVAKESRQIGQEDLKLDFHESFAKTQLTANGIAQKFNVKVKERLAVLGLDEEVASRRVWEVSFIPCSVYVFVDGSLMRGVLVEKMLEPAERYTKWNGNNGYVHGALVNPHHAAGPAEVQARKKHADEMMGAIAEGNEEEETDSGDDNDDNDSVGTTNDDDNTLSAVAVNPSATDSDSGGGKYGNSHARGSGHDDWEKKLADDDTAVTSSMSFAPTADCFAHAFSHYSYRYTKRKMLVCDLQGVLSNDVDNNDRPGLFELTDPVIHYRSTRGRKQVYGRTDLGKAGMHRFFETHQCNDVCRLLGLARKSSTAVGSVDTQRH